jgi:hypothetical protein
LTERFSQPLSRLPLLRIEVGGHDELEDHMLIATTATV